MTGSVVFVGAGPGDPELIPRRGWAALREADVVLYDSLVDTRLLEGLDAELLFVGKRCGHHSMPQEAITELLVRLALDGKRVVRLKGGDPTVLGRTGEEVLRLAQFGIPFEIVPGVSSADPAVHETPRPSGNGRLLPWRARPASRMAFSHATSCARPRPPDTPQQLQPGTSALAFFGVVGAVSLWAALVILH